MNIINQIIQREQKAINHFFNTKKISAPTLPSWIDSALIQHWHKLLFNLHYLPPVALEENLTLHLWQDRPNKYFYKKIKQGMLNVKAKFLPGKWILIDSRDKPAKKICWITSMDTWVLKRIGFKPKNYFKKKNKQIYEQEYLTNLLKQKGFGSRFCLSINDIHTLKPFILDLLKIQNKTIRLPYFMEYNYLGNNFYPNWAKTKTWEWFEDKFDKNQHLAGGSETVGCIGWEPPDFWSTILTFRPVVEV